MGSLPDLVSDEAVCALVLAYETKGIEATASCLIFELFDSQIKGGGWHEHTLEQEEVWEDQSNPPKSDNQMLIWSVELCHLHSLCRQFRQHRLPQQQIRGYLTSSCDSRKPLTGGLQTLTD